MSKPPQQHQVTLLLGEISRGNRRAAEDLLPLLYDELRVLARSRMAREKPGQTLEATALVHEAYLRLVGDADAQWDGRGHFFAAAAEAMRRILIERARRHARARHGGGVRRVTFDEGLAATEARSNELLAVDAALERLEAHDPAMAGVVKLRYFAGLSVEESAAALRLSPRTVNRLWTAARAFLRREIAGRDET